MRKKFYRIVIGLLLCFGFLIIDYNQVLAKEPGKNIVVVLDPGHGGIDGGASRVHGKVEYIEREINLKIAQYCIE